MGYNLTNRWTPLTPYDVQNELWRCPSRFIVVPAGRRSGKTEIAKRKLILEAITFSGATNGRFIFAAPTYSQAREIFWEDLKAMIPEWAFAVSRDKSIRESAPMTVSLWNGAKIQVMGLDKPSRIEGGPVDGIVLDEYGNMKPEVWTQHVRPALSTIGRPGWAWFIGVPEGRNHYYELRCDAIEGRLAGWSHFTWFTSLVNPVEAELAKAEMDILTWQQEYEGAFVSFDGRAYYSFGDHNITPRGEQTVYDPSLDLILTFDFNVSPGTASILQEQQAPRWMTANYGKSLGKISVGLDEVFIERNSNTEIVCDQIIDRWGHHEGRVRLFGDPSGGANKSSAVKGSDWDLIEQKLRPIFRHNLTSGYSNSAPAVRSRINATNSRCKAVDGAVRVLLDRDKCRHTIRDFEGVSLDKEGGLADKDGMLTHLSDGWGYYLEEQFPMWNNKLVKE